MEQFLHVIDGVACPSRDGSTFPVVAPSTGEVYGHAAFGKSEDVDAAVRSGAQAYEQGRWWRLPAGDRSAILRRCSAMIVERADEIAEVESKDSGKPVSMARAEVEETATLLDYYAGLTQESLGTVYSQPDGYFAYSTREPYGVVGAIAPWNYPFQLAAWKVVPALVAGNSVVLKMAEQTPASTTLLGLLLIEAGIPPGVVNVVHGDGPTTGAALAAHPDVPKITFTGSTEVGRAILGAGAEHIKSVHLELGGKTANIVMDDADLDQALDGSLFTSFNNSGQICTAGSRLLVQESIADEFVAALSERASTIVVGDPVDPATQMGPLVSAEQYDRVRGYIELGAASGARQVVPAGAALPSDGYFVRPTIFDQVDPGDRIAQEEIFGPVLSVIRFRDVDEAVAIANGVLYGLAATVWTNDLRRSFELSRRLAAGIIWTNCPNYLSWNVPYEGHRLSGLGEDLGKEALNTFTQLKVNYVAHAGQTTGWA